MDTRVSDPIALKLIKEVLVKFYLPTIQKWVDDMNSNSYHKRVESAEEMVHNLKIDYILEEIGWAPHVNLNRYDVYTLTKVVLGKPVQSWCAWDGHQEKNPKIEDITHPLERSNKPLLILWGTKVYLSGYGRYSGLEVAEKLRELYK